MPRPGDESCGAAACPIVPSPSAALLARGSGAILRPRRLIDAPEGPRMNPQPCLSRRRLLKRLALAVSLAPLAASRVRSALAADAPLLASSAPQARAVKYVEDAREAGGRTSGRKWGQLRP